MEPPTDLSLISPNLQRKIVPKLNSELEDVIDRYIKLLGSDIPFP